ncbi:MAG: protein kinase [Gemmatimonadota bacterium]|nr:MAG: protein kinase [Gemmatimonadota bacterium]
MANSLLERLRAALAQQYEVERELGAGGMGTVFLARDLTLDRAVAIKILRPELATAAAAERFLREARILAKLSHPNVVPIHSAGEADGLFYFVMDYVEGETAAQRLERGKLTDAEAVRMAADILSALIAAHAQHVVHRDVKPANVFLVGDRALLSDFGVAKPTSEESPELTAVGHRVGTPGYMAPEQVEGQATTQSDLYAAGMILYEALSGRHWSITTRVDQADWTGVPTRLVPVLRRALAFSLGDRWDDAAAFRQALLATQAPRVGALGRFARIAAPLVIIAAIAGYLLLRPTGVSPRPIRDLSVLPVQVFDWAAIDGADLAMLVTGEIESTPGVSAVPWLLSAEWWDSVSAAGVSLPDARVADALGARRAAFATLWGYGDSVEVELSVYDAAGDLLPGGRVRVGIAQAQPQAVSKAIALELVKIELDTILPRGPRITDDLDALQQYLLGEREFRLGHMRPAVAYYEASVGYDSTFVLAWWRLANAWRWLGERGPYEKNFQELFELYSTDLGPLDSMLMVAQLTPPGRDRLRRYREAHESFPLHYFAAYLHGEELFNRGPLWGESLDSAIVNLEEAVRLNPRWASTYVHLIWAYIRLGRQEDARAHLGRLARIAPDPDEGWIYSPELLAQAIDERFAPPDVVAEGRRAMLADPTFGSPGWLVLLARLAGAFDVPQTQLELGGVLLARAEVLPRPVQAAAHLVRGLGLVAVGRQGEALSHFDSAAALLGSAEAQLHAAEWRVLPKAVGLDVVEPAELERGRRALGALAGEDSIGVRALWALALDALARDDEVAARRLSTRVWFAPPGSGAAPLGEFLRAALEADAGRYAAALERSGRLLDVQTPTVLLSGSRSPGETLSDPFARAFLHLKRGAWYEAADSLGAAARAYLWYEAVDVLGLPSLELPQAGEIDWAFGNYGRYLRGRVELELGEREAACRHLERVAQLWDGASAGFAELAGEARELKERECGG